ncbi:4'-phosphopantetheinyl transferase superfamily protein [Mucilaginibacter sp. RCC_168]|uniref:4'-phosphopantetheinyl transferase family protein n=1 Tax=Mucilaginibacter sp. RCC_168 TaxID=3239221 RepID=UPI0035246BB3
MVNEEVCIFYTQFETEIPPAKFEFLLNLLPINLRDSVLKYRRWQDRHTSLLGKLLLRHALAQNNLANSLSELYYEDNGRPYLKALPIDFNISHSGNVVICALTFQYRLGIDLEEVLPIDLYDFKNQFNSEEWDYIITSENPLVEFYHYWTMKESIVKADGGGVSKLTNFKIINGNQTTLSGDQWFTHPVFIENNYKCHVTTQIETPRFKIQKLIF